MKNFILLAALLVTTSVFAEEQRCGIVQAATGGFVPGGQQQVLTLSVSENEEYQIEEDTNYTAKVKALATKIRQLKKKVVPEYMCISGHLDENTLFATGFTKMESLISEENGNQFCGMASASMPVAGGKQLVFLTVDENTIYDVTNDNVPVGLKIAKLKKSLKAEYICFEGTIVPKTEASPAILKAIKSSIFMP